MNKVVIFGGTGLIGSKLTELLAMHDYNVIVVTRDLEKARAKFENMDYIDLVNFLSIDDEIEITRSMNKADAVINLAGESLFGRLWTKKFKEEAFQSRIGTTKLVVELIKKTKDKPKVFISGSAIGYYGGVNDDRSITEKSPSGFDFLAQLCTAWENEANKLKDLVPRIINLRTGLVLSEDSGLVKLMSKPYKFRVGGYFRPGSQYFSWIHIDDLTYAIMECIENKKIKGAVNLTAPNPVTYKNLAAELAIVYKPLITLPIPRLITKLVLGEVAPGLIKGPKVIPEKLNEAKFVFKYPEVSLAIKDLNTN